MALHPLGGAERRFFLTHAGSVYTICVLLVFFSCPATMYLLAII